METTRAVTYRGTKLGEIVVTGDREADVELAAKRVEALFEAWPHPVPSPTRLKILARCMSASIRGVEDPIVTLAPDARGESAQASNRDEDLENEIVVFFMREYGVERLDAIFRKATTRMAMKLPLGTVVPKQ